MNEFLVYLNKIRLLSAPAAERIHKSFKLRKFPKGSYLIREGEQHDWVIFVLSGLIRSYSFENNVEVTKSFYWQNDLLITGTSLHPELPAATSLQSVYDALVLICPKEEFNRIYIDFPEFEHHGRIVLQRCFTQLSKLLDGIRMRNARDRYMFLLQEYPDLVLSVPNKHLASFLGMSHITFSRMRSKR